MKKPFTSLSVFSRHGRAALTLATLLAPAATLVAQISAGATFRQQPLSRAVCPGGTATFHVELDGAYDSLMWLHDGQVIEGETSKTLVLPNVDPATAAGEYTCVAGLPTGGAVSSQAAQLLFTSSQGPYQITRSAGPNPWCPLCPPPIIDPLDHIVPGTTTVVNLGSAESAIAWLDPNCVPVLDASLLPEDFRVTATGYIGDVEQDLGELQIKRDGVGLPWTMYGWFDFLGIARSASTQHVVILAGTQVLVDVPNDPHSPVTTAYFPEGLGKLGGRTECYVGQWRQLRPVTFQGKTYMCDQVQFLAEAPAGFPHISSKKELQIKRTMVTPTMAGAAGLFVSEVSGESYDCTSAAGEFSSVIFRDDGTAGDVVKYGLIGEYNPALGRSVISSLTAPGWDMPPPMKIRKVDTNGVVTTSFSWGVTPPAPGVVPPNFWTEVESAPALATEGRVRFSTPEVAMGPGGRNPELSLRVRGQTNVVQPPGAQDPVVCEMHQVWSPPSGTTPARVRLTCAMPGNDFTLQLWNGTALAMAYPCAGSPVINLPDWLKDIKLSQRMPDGTPAGELGCKPVIEGRFAAPTAIRVNFGSGNILVQCDRIVFLGENAPAPAVQGPAVLAYTSMAMGGGGGSGKVSMQDLHFTAHRAVAMGDVFVSAPMMAPGLLIGRRNGPFIDTGTVFDPYGPQPLALGVVPTTNGVAIKEKGTGAEKNRTIPIPIPPPVTAAGSAAALDMASVEDHRIPNVVGAVTTSSAKIKLMTVRTTWNVAGPPDTVVVPARISGAGQKECSMTLAFDECDAWSFGLAPLVAEGQTIPAGATIKLAAYGTVDMQNGQPPVTGASLGSLTGVCAAADAQTGDQPITLTPDFTPAGRADHRIRIKNHGAVVMDLSGRTGVACTLSRIPSRWGKLGGQTDCFTTSDPELFMVTVPNVAGIPAGVTLPADAVEIILSPSTTQGGPVVLARTQAVCSSTQCDWLAVYEQEIVSPRDPASGLPTGRRSRSSVVASGDAQVSVSHGNVDEDCDKISDDLLPDLLGELFPESAARLKNKTKSNNTNERVAFVADCAAGSGFNIDTQDAMGAEFGFGRQAVGGPDCGARALVTTWWRGRQNSVRHTDLALDRTPDGRCVISPDFTGFAPGQIEVYSWSFGASNPTSVGSSGLSAGRVATSGASFTSPVWPVSIGSACAAEGVLSGDIVWVNFPAPTEIVLAGAVRTVVRLAFVARPSVVVGPSLVHSMNVVLNETAKVSIQDFHFVFPPVETTLTPTPDGGMSFQVEAESAVILSNPSGDLRTWVVQDDYVSVRNPNGSVSNTISVSPSLQRAFFQAEQRHKGWDGTIKGR